MVENEKVKYFVELWNKEMILLFPTLFLQIGSLGMIVEGAWLFSLLNVLRAIFISMSLFLLFFLIATPFPPFLIFFLPRTFPGEESIVHCRSLFEWIFLWKANF